MPSGQRLPVEQEFPSLRALLRCERVDRLRRYEYCGVPIVLPQNLHGILSSATPHIDELPRAALRMHQIPDGQQPHRCRFGNCGDCRDIIDPELGCHRIDWRDRIWKIVVFAMIQPDDRRVLQRCLHVAKTGCEKRGLDRKHQRHPNRRRQEETVRQQNTRCSSVAPIVGSSNTSRRKRSVLPRLIALSEMAVTPAAR